MNIHDVKNGLAAGKRFRRTSRTDDGRKERESMRPTWRNMDGVYGGFVNTYTCDLDDSNGSAGGSATLPLTNLPGRFDVDGWEEDTA